MGKPRNTRHTWKFPKYQGIPENKKDTGKYPIIYLDTPTRPAPDPLPDILSNTRPNIEKTYPLGTAYRVFFFNWASPANASTGHPYFEKVLSIATERGQIPNTLTFSIPWGVQSAALTFF